MTWDVPITASEYERLRVLLDTALAAADECSPLTAVHVSVALDMLEKQARVGDPLVGT